MNWNVSCLDCQEPVGKPWWKDGCACQGTLTESQAMLLAVINQIWDDMKWEEV
jgi:hypothetical protein